jgi:hypothetical protein
MCSISLQRPDNSATFLRLDLTFPDGQDQLPSFEVSKSSMMSLAARNQIQVKLGQIYARSTLANPLVECFANLLSLAGGVLTDSVLKKVASQANLRMADKIDMPPAPITKIVTGSGNFAVDSSEEFSSGSSGSEDQIRVFRGIWNDVRGGNGEVGLTPSTPNDPDSAGGRTPVGGRTPSRKSFVMEGLSMAGPENLSTFVPYPRLCGAVFSQTGIF